jgi:hypothetical protein
VAICIAGAEDLPLLLPFSLKNLQAMKRTKDWGIFIALKSVMFAKKVKAKKESISTTAKRVMIIIAL